MAAPYTSWYSLDSNPGPNFNATYLSGIVVTASATSTSGLMDQGYGIVATDALGTVHKGINNSEWILVKASTTITQYMLCVIDDNFNANPFTTALAVAGGALGAAQFTTYLGQTITTADPAVNPVFWACVRGSGIKLAASGSVGTGAAVGTGTSAGYVSISATGSTLKRVMFMASAGATAAAAGVEAYISYPGISLFG